MAQLWMNRLLTMTLVLQSAVALKEKLKDAEAQTQSGGAGARPHAGNAVPMVPRSHR